MPSAPASSSRAESIEVNGAGFRPDDRGSACCPRSGTRRSAKGHRGASSRRARRVAGAVARHRGSRATTPTATSTRSRGSSTTKTIVTVTCDDPRTTNYASRGRTSNALRASATPRVSRSGSSSCRCRGCAWSSTGARLPLTYANFYIANGGVLVPLYGDVNDQRALDILRPLFPGRDVRASWRDT